MCFGRRDIMIKLDSDKLLYFFDIDINTLSKLLIKNKYLIIYLEYLINLVNGFFNNEEKTKLWFNTPNPQLADLSPKNLILMGKEIRVRQFIEFALSQNEID